MCTKGGENMTVNSLAIPQSSSIAASLYITLDSNTLAAFPGILPTKTLVDTI